MKFTKINQSSRFVILSEAKNLLDRTEILRFAQDDNLRLLELRRFGFVLFLLVTLFASCGGEAGTGVSNPPAPSTKASAAVSALFSGDSEASENVALKIPKAILNRAVKEALAEPGNCGDDDPACTCESGDPSDQPQGVENSPYNDAGTYGASTNAVTLEADDFCELPDGTENSGLGPDGIGRFAAFEITEDILGNCGSGDDAVAFAFKSGSSGVFRNTPATGDTPAYMPQIYGEFIFEVDGEQTTVNCTIYLLEDESVAASDCSDASGTAIDQDADASCSF